MPLAQVFKTALAVIKVLPLFQTSSPFYYTRDSIWLFNEPSNLSQVKTLKKSWNLKEVLNANLNYDVKYFWF